MHYSLAKFKWAQLGDLDTKQDLYLPRQVGVDPAPISVCQEHGEFSLNYIDFFQGLGTVWRLKGQFKEHFGSEPITLLETDVVHNEEIFAFAWVAKGTAAKTTHLDHGITVAHTPNDCCETSLINRSKVKFSILPAGQVESYRLGISVKNLANLIGKHESQKLFKQFALSTSKRITQHHIHQPILQYLQNIFDPNLSGHLLRLNARVNLLSFFKDLALSDSPSYQFKNKSSVLKKIDELILSANGRNLDLDKICKSLDISFRTLDNLFQEEYGISINKKVRQVNLEFAKTQIMQTSKSIFDIAHESGYSNQSSFTQAFIREFKVSPSSLRKT